MSDVLNYKDYYGSVAFSAEDECFYGKITGIDDLVTFEGTTVEELKTAFVEAVEDYLEMCSALGKAPAKTYKGTFNIRIAPELHRQLANYATVHRQSLNATVEEAIKEYVVNRGNR